MSDFAPTDVKAFHFRPLNKGMVRTLPSTELPPGAFVTIENYTVTAKGLKRRPGITSFSGGASVDYPPVRGIGVLWKDTGSNVGFVYDTKFFYKLLVSGFNSYYWDYDTSETLHITGGDLDQATVTGLDFSAAGVLAGDILVIESGATVLESLEVSDITNASHLDFESAATDSYADADFTIRRAIAGDDRLPLHTIVENKAILADGTRGLFQFDGDSLTNYCESGIDPVAESIIFFNDRLWAGRTYESGSDKRWRTRWTGVTDYDYFDSGWYLDLPYVPGHLVRQLPLGQLLVSYFEDSIWLGRPTNVPGNDLPYAFEQLPTGRVGLVGPQAVCQWLDGHFFLGQDGPYYLSASGGLQELGDVITSDMIDSDWDLEYSQVIPVPHLDCIFFGISETPSGINKIWVYNYKSKGWSLYPLTGGVIGLEEVVATYTWDTLDSAYTWTTGITGYTSWNNLVGSTGRPEAWISAGGTVQRFEESAPTDPTGNISARFVTGDHDFGAPGISKIYLRFGLKIDQVLSTPLVFTVKGSVDLGDSWKTLGTLTIESGTTEGFINFRMFGSTIRFDVQSTTSVTEYTILEYTTRVKGVGKEVRFA